MFDIGKNHFLIKSRYCSEISVQAHAGVDTGVFSQK